MCVCVCMCVYVSVCVCLCVCIVIHSDSTLFICKFTYILFFHINAFRYEVNYQFSKCFMKKESNQSQINFFSLKEFTFIYFSNLS